MAEPAGEYLPPLVTKLKADISDFKKGLSEAKKIQKDYKDDLDGLSTSFDKTKRSAAGAGQGVSDFERLVRSKSRTGELAVSTMRAEYDRLNESVKTLRKTLAGQGAGTDSEKTFRELKEALNDLQRLGGIAADFGIKLGDATGKGLANGAAAGGPYVQAAVFTALIGGAVLAAPFIGATIAAALTLAMGGAVIALGAYILKENPKIQAAWTKLTETTSGIFHRAAANLEKPFVKAIRTIETEFKKLEKPLKKLFDAAAPLIQPLAEGVMGALAAALPGLTEAVKNSEPAFKTLGEQLPKIGKAFGDFFATITADPEALSTIIIELTNLLTVTLFLISHVLLGLTKVNDWMTRAALAVGSALTTVANTLIGWWNSAKEWVGSLFKGLGSSIVTGMISGISSKSLNLENALVGIVRAAWLAAKSFLKTGSPSKLFRQLGEWTVGGYVQGVDSNMAKVWASWAGMLNPGRANRGAVGVAGYDAARAGMGSRAAALSIAAAPVVLQLDGRVIYESTIKYGQRGALRNVSTGLARAGATA